MKTILFRAKKITDNQWVNGGIAIAPDETVIILTKEEQIVWNVIPETVGQFTGVADKNEKEIYEGDIIQDEQSKYNEKYIVRWSVGNCGFVAQPQNQDKVYPNLNPGTTRHLIIIGNIHDNPELLNNSF